MSEPKMTLFVGGIMDGRRIYVPENMMIFKAMTEDFQTVWYHAEKIAFADSSDTIRIFRTQALTNKETFQLLIDGYQPKEQI